MKIITRAVLVLACALVAREGEGIVKKTEQAIFGAGCFWCVEAVFERIPGVFSVTSGYSGGTNANPTYKEVCTGKTGHAEVVKVEYDPAVVSYAKLLETFWATHDPTTPDRQGADVGTQYRSVVFYTGDEQKAAAEGMMKTLQQEQFKRKIVTQILPAGAFYPAEEYHQDYFRQNPSAPYCRIVIAPKLKKLK